MKNLFKYIGIISVFLFSFYYTEKMSNIIINNSSLVMQINENVDKYNILPVNAIIDENYIVPGINGSNVNVIKSYNNMKVQDVFNEYYLVYDKVIPNVNLENNKDKIIKNGNRVKNSVSILVENNIDVIEYSKEKNISITRLINYDSYDKYAKYEQINNDFNNYKKVEKLLNNNNINKNICLINSSNIDFCKENKKYLVDKTIELNNYNLSDIKNNIQSGYIIFISDNVNVTDYKILIKQIYYQDLDIISLSTLITEERD